MTIALPAALFAASPAGAHHAFDAPAVAASCYTLQSYGNASYVQRSGAGYRATGTAASAEHFRAMPTGLGRHLLVDSTNATVTGGPGDVVRSTAAGSRGSDWRVMDSSRGSVVIDSPNVDGAIGLVGESGRLGLVDADTAGYDARFRAAPVATCSAAPEVETNVTGPQSKGATAFATTRGFLDTHVHLMAFEFLGGRAHCGKPWDNARRHRRAQGLSRPRAQRRGSGPGELPQQGIAGRHARYRRLADVQGLASSALAHPRADLLQVDRAGLARRSAHDGQPARGQRGRSATSIRSRRTPATT